MSRRVCRRTGGPRSWTSAARAAGAPREPSSASRSSTPASCPAMRTSRMSPRAPPRAGAIAPTRPTQNGHGTQLAGIAAGKDPGRATRGVAPAARLIPIKVSCGLVTADALTKGVDRAIAEKAGRRPPRARRLSRRPARRVGIPQGPHRQESRYPLRGGIRLGRRRLPAAGVDAGSTMPSSSPR